MTAVIMAFHHLLSHVYFEVYMDHSAIVYIMKAKDEPQTDRIARLLEILQKYSFVVKYQKGQDMWIADFLSRVAQEPETDGIIPISFDAARSLIAPMETQSMRWVREQAEKAPPAEPVSAPSPETGNQNTAGQSKQTQHLGREPERLVIDTLPPPRDVTMLWPTAPVAQQPTADPRMQQIAEMLWQNPAFEALEEQERASDEVYPPEMEVDFHGYLPHNQTMDRAAEMDLPEDLGAREEKPLYMTIPTNVQKGGAVLSQYPQQKDLNKLLRHMSQTALHYVHLPIGVHKLIAEYSRSPFFKGIYRYLTTQQTGMSGKADCEFRARAGQEYVLISGLLFHVVWPTKEHRFPEVRLCIPEKYVPYVLHKYHKELVAGHQGVNRTFWQHFWFPRMYDTIITYIKSCHRCQEAKEPAKLPIASFARILVNFHPFDRMSMDVKCMIKS